MRAPEGTALVQRLLLPLLAMGMSYAIAAFFLCVQSLFGGRAEALFVLLHWLAWGARGPLMQALRADYFGSSSFGAIMGISSLIVMLGTTLGPLIAGILTDVTGSYRAGFIVLGVLAGLGLTFFVLATPPTPPSRTEPTGQDRLGLGREQHGAR